MKKLLMLFALLMFMQSCTKEGNGGGQAAIDIESSLGLLVSDGQGNDLLAPTSTSPKAVDFSKVKLYFIRDGKEVPYFRENLDIPRGLRLYTPESHRISRYELEILLDSELGERISTTILDWGDGHRDVFKAEFHRWESGTLIMRKVWLNDELVWERDKTQPKEVPGIAEIEITR